MPYKVDNDYLQVDIIAPFSSSLYIFLFSTINIYDFCNLKSFFNPLFNLLESQMILFSD